MTLRAKLIIIALIGTLVSSVINQINYSYLEGQFPAKKGMLTSADEASYFAPPTNFMNSGTWKDNSIGISSYIQRPPGYGFVFLVCKKISPSHPFVLLKVVQTICFFFLILLFGLILEKAPHLNQSVLIYSTFLFSILPCYSGFSWYTLTESITPFLMLWTVYTWLNYIENKRGNIRFIGANGFLILVRPQLIIFPILYSCYGAISGLKLKKVLYMALLFLPFVFWQVRSLSIQKEGKGIHPIYSVTNHSLYRPVHHSLCDLFRVWEHDGQIFHETVAAVIEKDYNLEELSNNIPLEFRSEVIPLLKEYREVYNEVSADFASEEKVLGEFISEKLLRAKIEKLTTNYQARYWDLYYFITPLNSFKKLIFSSHLNLKIFQKDFRGVWFIELLRWFSLMLIAGSIAITLLYGVCTGLRNRSKWTFLCWGVFAYVFYLAFVQRMNEERYLTPLLPLCLLISIIVLSNFYQRNHSKRSGST